MPAPFPGGAIVTFLEFRRRERGLSQRELSRRTRLEQSFISQIERGTGIPTPDQAQRLARELGLPPDLLLKTVAVDLETSVAREVTAP
jgi:transcriptional regulator with XRE-family HTH domain